MILYITGIVCGLIAMEALILAHKNKKLNVKITTLQIINRELNSQLTAATLSLKKVKENRKPASRKKISK